MDYESDDANHGVRQYNQLDGRFYCPDALWEKYYSLSPYQYAGNNPVMRLDPSGLFEIAGADEIGPHKGEKNGDIATELPEFIALLKSMKDYAEKTGIIDLIAEETGISRSKIVEDFEEGKGPKIFLEYMRNPGWHLENQKLSINKYDAKELQNKKYESYVAGVAVYIFTNIVHEYLHDLGYKEDWIVAFEKKAWPGINVYRSNIVVRAVQGGFLEEMELQKK